MLMPMWSVGRKWAFLNTSFCGSLDLVSQRRRAEEAFQSGFGMIACHLKFLSVLYEGSSERTVDLQVDFVSSSFDDCRNPISSICVMR